MAITASFADLANGTYTGRIMDALGDTGASLTLTGTKPGSFAIGGTPTGLGLRIVAGQQANLASRPGRDAVTLSPAAQARLSELQVAADLLKTSGKPDAPPATPRDGTRQADPALPPPAPAPTTDPSDVAALAAENPTQVIRDLVGAAQQAVGDAAGFYAVTASDPTLLGMITSGLSDDDKASFMAAYASKTLTLQNAADVAGWQYSAQVTLTGTGETETGGGLGGFSTQVAGVNSTFLDFGVAQLAISWPKTA